MPIVARDALLLGGIALAGLLLLARPHDPVDDVAHAVVSHAATGPRIRYPAGASPTLNLPGGERRSVESVLAVTQTMKFGDYLWDDDQVPHGPTWIRIDLAAQMLSVFRGGHEIGSAVILYGTDGKPTPTGLFPVLEKAQAHRSTLYDAEMPFMLRLTGDGVAIHASDVREGSATHGCIGVPREFARRLFQEVRRGDLVAIVRSDGAAAPASQKGTS